MFRRRYHKVTTRSCLGRLYNHLTKILTEPHNLSTT